jgi:hypothetical protein
MHLIFACQIGMPSEEKCLPPHPHIEGPFQVYLISALLHTSPKRIKKGKERKKKVE